MIWDRLDAAQGQAGFEDFKNLGTFSCPEKYKKIREDLIIAFNSVLKAMHIDEKQINYGRNSYLVDMFFGIMIYELLNDKYDMNPRTASDPCVWRYLSINVVPDIVVKRYDFNHPDRFWKKDKRIWLRYIWWYVHLSWQGNIDKTVEVLKNNSTDEIAQLVDRCGKGYRVELCREMMKDLYDRKYPPAKRQEMFRKTMVLNTARVGTVEPELFEGGNKGYIESLYKNFE